MDCRRWGYIAEDRRGDMRRDGERCEEMLEM
jgi:hypothetical protein